MTSKIVPFIGGPIDGQTREVELGSGAYLPDIKVPMLRHTQAMPFCYGSIIDSSYKLHVYRSHVVSMPIKISAATWAGPRVFVAYVSEHRRDIADSDIVRACIRAEYSK